MSCESSDGHRKRKKCTTIIYKIGAQGAQGPAGIGAQGAQGNQGPQGPSGVDGAQGAQGSQGEIGPQGESGIGAQGPQGPQGPAGVDGAQGPQGDPGIGSQGPQGDIGPQGAQGEPGGAQGNQGSQGSQGAQGAQGDPGSGGQGPQGDIGPQGPQGDTGAQGFQGPQGDRGLQGAQGNQGPQGPLGPQGPRGAQGAQGPQGSTNFPPVPNADYYVGRTNEIITLNVVSGVIGNTFGVDTPGGALVAPAIPITTVSIIKTPSFGTLTSTGPVGAYTYQSDPRFTGYDLMVYKVIDSSGVTSKNTATLTLKIGGEAPTTIGPQFIYSLATTDNVFYYDTGVSTVMFTATYPGYTDPNPPPVGPGALATNRDDNLIYYCNHSATGGNRGKVYAYDYVTSNGNILVFDADVLFPTLPWITGGGDFRNNGAVYNAGILYITVNGANSFYYRIILGPYNPVTATQSVIQVTQIALSGNQLVDLGDMAWDHISNNLLILGTIAGAITLLTVNPDSGTVITSVPVNNGFAEITSTIDNRILVASSSIRGLNTSTGVLQETYPAVASAVRDMGEWYNLPPTL